MSVKRIIFVIYDGFELLDMSGPSAVFSTADLLSDFSSYQCHFVSVGGGTIRSGCGLPVITEKASMVEVSAYDTTVLVMGAEEEALLNAAGNSELSKFMVNAVHNAERAGSICTGAFILAAAGVLKHKSATTHWAAVERFSDMFDNVDVLPDAMYHVDGNIWTSAGVTTGIDMALAMVEADLGAHIMNEVARRLVVYSHRPGNQSQFSHILGAQMASGRQFSDVINWIQNNLDKQVKVEDMASRAGMSERTFYRKFTEATGVTPSKFLENVRLDLARQLIASGQAINMIANAVGFKSQAGFRTAFEAKYGISPSLYRRMNYKEG
ncbi:MAG: GlxA family transcriptional regulator [Methyloligellaceae bacterium]